MYTKKICYPKTDKVFLECYLLDSGLKLGQDTARPAVVICPGGGYVYLSPRESEPVALAYAAKGFQTFILHYSIGRDAKGFAPQTELGWALGLIRENSNSWNIDPGKIAVCGFSAGGHLALSCGLIGPNRPNALILGYPAIELWDGKNPLMSTLLTGKPTPDEGEIRKLNLTNQVTKEAPPLFVFTTGEDALTRRQTLELVQAYDDCGLLCEYHIFQFGPHGYSLADAPSADGSSQVMDAHAAKWLDLSTEWLLTVFGSLTFRDISSSHIMEAVKKLGS